MLNALRETPPSLQDAIEDARRWDATVKKLTRDYGAAKLAANAAAGCPVAASAFAEKGDLLMQAMQERHRCETLVRELGRRLHRFR